MIKNRAKLDLKDKFDEWEGWLLGDDVNSVRNQIHDMIWDTAVFLSINKAREYAPKNKDGQPELNGTVHHFINRCFLQTQLIAIRRLCDKEKSAGDRSVVSLYRLIRELENNIDILTRKNVLGVLGYPYDYANEENAILERINPLETALPEDYGKCVQSEGMHQNFDKLSEVTPDRRNPDDKIQPKIFEWLKNRLDECEKDICSYVNKFLAHAATPESRRKYNADDIKITLGHILDAHKIICEITGFTMNIFNHSLGGFLPTPQFDQFEYFEKPCIAKNDLEKLYTFWNNYANETEEWLNWD